MSKKLFLPLRKLNFKLNTIIQEGMNRELTQVEKASYEITELYNAFSAYIKTKKFEKNDFTEK